MTAIPKKALWASQVLMECLREAGDDVDAGFAAAEYILSTEADSYDYPRNHSNQFVPKLEIAAAARDDLKYRELRDSLPEDQCWKLDHKVAILQGGGTVHHPSEVPGLGVDINGVVVNPHWANHEIEARLKEEWEAREAERAERRKFANKAVRSFRSEYRPLDRVVSLLKKAGATRAEVRTLDKLRYELERKKIPLGKFERVYEEVMEAVHLRIDSECEADPEPSCCISPAFGELDRRGVEHRAGGPQGGQFVSRGLDDSNKSKDELEESRASTSGSESKPPRSPKKIAVSFSNQLLGILKDLNNGDTDPDQAQESTSELFDRTSAVIRRTVGQALRQVESETTEEYGDAPEVAELVKANRSRIVDSYNTMLEVLAESADNFLTENKSGRGIHRTNLISASDSLQRAIDTSGDFIAENLEPTKRSKQLQDAIRRGMRVAAKLEANEALNPKDERILEELADEKRFWRVSLEDGKLMARYPGGERPIHITSQGGREVRPEGPSLSVDSRGVSHVESGPKGGQFTQRGNEGSPAVSKERQRKRDFAKKRGEVTEKVKGAATDVSKKSLKAAVAAGAKLGAAEHFATQWTSERVEALPTALRLPLKAIYYAAFGTFIAGQKAARAVAAEVGGEEHADRVAKTLATIDSIAAVGAKAAGIAGVHGPVGVPLVVPVASASYLAYSGVRHPVATFNAAAKGVEAAMKKLKGAKSQEDKKEGGNEP